MNLSQPLTPADDQNCICPDIREYWKLSQRKRTNQIILQSIQGNRRFQFSAVEGYALLHFTGQYTAFEIQNLLNQKFKQATPPNAAIDLLQKLIALGILTADLEEENSPQIQKSSKYRLKASVQWSQHPDGYWVLRNLEDFTFMQVSDRDKTIIEQLGHLPTNLIVEEFCITPDHLKGLLQFLAATGMLEGTSPAKPRRGGKFSPFQLLSFQVRLFNPDPFLTRHIDKLRLIWTNSTAFLLCIFLTISTIIGLNQQPEIVFVGQKLFATYGGALLVPFVLLTAFVVTLHELGHAFTLKHFGGIVPEVGLLFMFLIPAAYTNTTDQYHLSKFQRILVVGAGVLVQLILAAIGLWLWNLAVTGTWLSTTSFLLMAAALFTVALNLNPLARFDGYYLAVAITGINNLRKRSFAFYANLLTGKKIVETRKDSWILAIYAPFSLAYIWFVFGYLLVQIAEWNLTNIPITAGMLLFLWGIYFLLPNSRKE